MKCKSVCFLLVMGVIFGLVFSSPVRAQVSGATLSGTITDAQGGAVAGAKVSIKNLGTGISTDVDTNDTGAYSVPNLTPADYEVSVTAAGFSTTTSKVTLTVGAKQEMNIKLTVGQVSQTVEVTGAALAVDLASSTISGNVVGTEVRELPLNGRDWTSLATLQPGVTAVRSQIQISSGLPTGNRGLGMQLTISGNRPTQNTYRQDGAIVNDYSNAGPGSILGQNLGVDAIQEFTVLTTNYSSEYGFTSGGVINAVTRSGTNTFHGTAFDFVRNDKFDAANFFDNYNGRPKSEFRLNQFGGSAGAPVIKNKLFAFGDYEGVRYVKGVLTTNNAPSPAVLAGIVTNTTTKCVYNLTAGTVTGCADGTTATFTPTPIDPNIKQLLPLFPANPGGSIINANSQVFPWEARNNANENFYTTRWDYKATDKDNIGATYVHDTSDLNVPLAYEDTVTAAFSYRENFILEETHVFSSSFVNAVRAAVARSLSDGGSTPSCLVALACNQALSEPGVATAQVGPAAPGLSGTGITGIAGEFSPTHQIYALQTDQLFDDAFYSHGNHSMKFGFAVMRLDYKAYSTRGGNGGGTFSGSLNGGFVPNGCTLSGPGNACGASGVNGGATGALLDFLTNQPLSATRYADYPNIQARYPRETVPAGYFQDDWKIRPNLTLNLGVRYEMMTLPTEKYGRVAYLQSLTATATQLTNQILARNVTTKNFDPRIGFAWDPFHDGKTAVRGGFGLFNVLPLSYTTNLTMISGAPIQPFFPTIGTNNTYNGVSTAIPSVYAGTAASPGGEWPYVVPGIVANAVTNLPQSTQGRQYGYSDQNIKRNYVYQYNLNIQRQITPNTQITVAYAGSRAVHNPVQLDAANSVVPKTTSAGYVWPVPWTFCTGANAPKNAGCTAAASPQGLNANFDPNVGPIQAVLWAGSSYYNGLQVRVDKKMSRGFQIQGSFTFSKSLDDSSTSFAGDAFSNAIATVPFYALQSSKGLSDFNVTRNLVINGLWNAPTPKNLGMIGNRVLGGWQLSSIITVADGAPLSVVSGSESPDLLGEQNPTFPVVNINTGANACSPSQYTNEGASTAVRVANYINVSCFGLVQQNAATLAAGCDVTRATALAAPGGGIPGLVTSCPNIRGDLSRNSLVGPHLINFDFSIFKNNYVPKISETFNIQFRAEAFDVFNHPNFALPTYAAAPTNLEIINNAGAVLPGSPTKLSATQSNEGRQIQLALKMIW